MKITHYSNAFHLVTAGDTKLVCDPWVGVQDNNAWITYPLHKDNPGILNDIGPDAIYISHLHCDHFDRKTLLEIDNKDIRFIIKDFPDHRLAGQIRELGFSNIDECEPWREIEISPDMTVTVVPQDSNNISEHESDIVYDLDTSLIVRDLNTNCVFYNNVDNPLTVKGFGDIRDYVSEKFDTDVDICCIPIGAGSEFPQCFLNIDRAEEGRKLIDDALENFKHRIEALKPKAWFFAGGSYIVYGKYNMLTHLIAQPSSDEQKKYVQDNLDVQYLDANGGETLTHDGEKWVKSSESVVKRCGTVTEALAEFKDINYDYWDTAFTPDEIDRLYGSACENFFRILDKRSVDMKWRYKFHLYDNLRLTEDGQISPDSQIAKTYELTPPVEGEIVQNLTLHMDDRLFGRLLTGQHNWNQSLSGTYIMFERTPNQFYPDVTGALNFLRA